MLLTTIAYWAVATVHMAVIQFLILGLFLIPRSKYPRLGRIHNMLIITTMGSQLLCGFRCPLTIIQLKLANMKGMDTSKLAWIYESFLASVLHQHGIDISENTVNNISFIILLIVIIVIILKQYYKTKPT